MRWFVGIIDPMNMCLGKLWKIVKDREAWLVASLGSQIIVRHDLGTEKQK